MDARTTTILFREVNERIGELLTQAGLAAEADFLCECGAECGRKVTLRLHEYEQLRRRGGSVVADECAPRANETVPAWPFARVAA